MAFSIPSPTQLVTSFRGRKLQGISCKLKEVRCKKRISHASQSSSEMARLLKIAITDDVRLGNDFWKLLVKGAALLARNGLTCLMAIIAAVSV